MTISSTANRISYAGNGSTTAFSFPYLFFADDDLKVVLVVDATGVETTKTLTTHYTVAGETVAAGGTVTMVTAPASGETLVIIRQEQFTQGLDLVENDPFPSDNVEQQFDILTMLSQQLNDEVSRAFKLSDGDTSGADLTVATPTADQLVGWNNAGLALENKDPADITNMSIYYLGPYAADPTTNNAGGVLVEGNIYFDTVNDYFKIYDGAAWGIGVSGRTWATFTYTASGAETSVSGADDDAATLAYTAGQIRVFLNGVLLDGADYTATTGTSITGLAALTASDILFVEAYDNVAALGTIADQDADAVAITGGTITGTTGAAQTITALTTTTINGVAAATEQFTSADGVKLDGIEAGADVTDATNVTAAGALMDSELADVAAVKALDQGVATTDSPTFVVITGATLEATGDTSAGDNAAIGYTAAEGLILTGQGSTNDVTIKNDADADVLVIPTGTTNVDIVGVATAATFEPDGDTAASDNAAIGYTAAEGLILTGQGSTNDVTVKNDADADVLVVPTGTTNVDIVGVATASTFEPDGDTSAGDNAAMGYAAADGLVLTGQGSTGDITIRNDADALVVHVPTGTTGMTFAGDITVAGTITRAAGADLALDLIVSGAGNPYIRIQGQGVDWITQVRNTANGDTYKIRDNTNGVDALVLTPVTGAATFAGVLDVSAGTGITFDSGSNHLDDYEEGTVVATITTGTSGTITLNTSYDELQYTKVGNVCHIQGQLITTSVSSPVGSYIQINLPFTAVSGTGKRSSISIASFGLGGGSTYTVHPNQIIEAGAVLYVYLDASTVQASDQFYIGGSYTTA